MSQVWHQVRADKRLAAASGAWPVPERTRSCRSPGTPGPAVPPPHTHTHTWARPTPAHLAPSQILHPGSAPRTGPGRLPGQVQGLELIPAAQLTRPRAPSSVRRLLCRFREPRRPGCHGVAMTTGRRRVGGSARDARVTRGAGSDLARPRTRGRAQLAMGPGSRRGPARPGPKPGRPRGRGCGAGR